MSCLQVLWLPIQTNPNSPVQPPVLGLTWFAVFVLRGCQVQWHLRHLRNSGTRVVMYCPNMFSYMMRNNNNNNNISHYIIWIHFLDDYRIWPLLQVVRQEVLRALLASAAFVHLSDPSFGWTVDHTVHRGVRRPRCTECPIWLRRAGGVRTQGAEPNWIWAIWLTNHLAIPDDLTSSLGSKWLRRIISSNVQKIPGRTSRLWLDWPCFTGDRGLLQRFCCLYPSGNP